MLWAGWAWSSRRAEVTHDDISYSFSGSCWCSHFLSQDLHVSQGAVDSSVDMDRLNRNMPECARQTRQVLQVSVFLLGVGEGASDWEREGLRPYCSQVVFNTWKKTAVKCYYGVTFQSGPILSQWVLSSSDNCAHWCWMSPHWLLGQCFITRTLHNNDKHRERQRVRSGSPAGTRPDSICHCLVKQESSASN